MYVIAKLINIKWHPFCNIEFQLPQTDQIIYMAIQCSNRTSVCPGGQKDYGKDSWMLMMSGCLHELDPLWKFGHGGI